MGGFRLPELSKFDLVARDSRNLAFGRIVAAALAVLLVYRTLGATVGLVWGGAQLTCEILIWLSTGPLTRETPGSPAQRLRFMAATVANSCVWLALSLVFWRSPILGSAFTALLIWGCLLVNATSFAFRSPVAFAMFAAPVTVVLTLTPLLLPRFHGPQQVMVCVGAFILAAYAILSARRNMVAAHQLADAHAALERERAAAESANLAKSAFLATMSHEIRTPLNGVIGMAQAMARDDLPDTQRDRLAVIRSGGEALLCLLNDLLDLSRIEAGRLELEDGVVDVAEIAASAQAAFTALAADKDIHLELDVAPAAQGCWRGDPTRVRQVLYNLVSNAVKFTAPRLGAHRGDARRQSPLDGGFRHWAGHSHRTVGGAVREIRPGRRLDHPTVRRLRPRPGDLPGAGGADGRPGEGGEPRGRGLHLHPDPAPGPRGAQSPVAAGGARAVQRALGPEGACG
jgi:signal transduction histidine kinase